MSIKKADLLVLVALLAIIVQAAACGGKRDWYNYSDTEAVFEQDLSTCKDRARQRSSKHSLSGDDIVLNSYNSNLLQCLYSKGWTHVSPKSLQELEETFSRNVRLNKETNRITAFKEKINLTPGEFELLHKNSSAYGPGYIKEMNFRGPGSVYLNLVFQKNLGKRFEKSAYPVDSSFVLYDSGTKEYGSKLIHWSVYCGKYEDEWIMGLGSYVLLGPKKRITITITREMIAPQKDPVHPLRLSRKQYRAVEEFEDKWLDWLYEAFGG